MAFAGKPVIDVPGETPTSPSTMLPDPLALTAEPPTIAKVAADPSDWAEAGTLARRATAVADASTPNGTQSLFRLRIVVPPLGTVVPDGLS